ncbi:hypothetical protein A5672_24930 [Mycobacterium alsense]|uniref:SnoaL-like domain-containing protein n=1 Tax=Mycobacterium alsense TaxID=324058 RepID=A0ABD6NZZ8_9MYCO|nr:nuclear transport factor 2 family protein [Mycobacterium alsense]OBG32982.1 hypothetical protein A5672_24930 [Mycobacterium alsense]OBJ00632.1 hypothetical protein A5660_24855 [Mycobacterium alsense]
MTSADTLIDQLRIRGLIERYCMLLDVGAADELIEMFDEKCLFRMMGQSYRDRGELATAITVNGGRANAVTGWAMLDRSGPRGTTVALAGRYLDELARCSDGTWRFTVRQVQALARPLAATDSG